MTHEHDSHRIDTTRRTFLRGASALVATGWLAQQSFAALNQQAPQGLTGHRERPLVLVMLELTGGNDGLNAMPPQNNDIYRRERGDLAITDGFQLTETAGLHPELKGLHRLYGDGKLAIIEGVGYPDPQRSHFVSRDIWHTADQGGRTRDTGWLGRLADAHFVESGNPNSVLSLGTRVPYSCKADHCRAVAVSRPAAFRVLGNDKLVETLDTAIAAEAASDRAREFLRRSYMDARRSSEAVRNAAQNHKPQADYPKSELADDLRLIAGLISGGLDTRVFTVNMSGFDTHSKQAARQAKLLNELDGALSAFLADIEKQNSENDVVVLVHSEFGRRVTPNGSGGTDHGTAGPVFVAGHAVHGGLYGAQPDLGNLDERGDIRFTTDFRSVYATILEKGYGVASEPLLGGPWNSLGFLDT
ncbi:MAG: DUF1501 domain-containing protein [Planctomycetota bacterium]|nr:DUF1501 domain-containing protein [Planctomycetota bacterium]